MLWASTGRMHCYRKACLIKDCKREWKSDIINHREHSSLFQVFWMIIRAHSVWSRGEAGQAGRIISFLCLSVIESVALWAGFVFFRAMRKQCLHEAGYLIIWTSDLIQHGKCYDPVRKEIHLYRKSCNQKLWTLDASKNPCTVKGKHGSFSLCFSTYPFLFSMPEEFMIRLGASSKGNFQLPNRFVQ